MERTIAPDAARRLQHRAQLALDPKGAIAIKRDVHEFIVAADPDAFVRAFTEVLVDPDSTFGLIRVRRPAERMGQAFEEGERFQGCFSIQRAIRNKWSARGPWLDRLLDARPTAAVIGWLEDQMLSNYAQVREIVLTETERRVHYVYLDGTPIAGGSTFTIEAHGDGQCKVHQIFEYQEQDGMALQTFQRFGLKMHDQVVWEQIHQTAARLGAEVLSASIPREYSEL